MNSQGPQQHSITEAAAEWAVRLHAGALTEQEQAELRHWIACDSRHEAALRFAEQTWAALGEVHKDEPVHRQRPASPPAPARRPKRRRPWQRAAAVALVVVVAGVGWLRGPDVLLHMQADYVTQKGEIRTVLLADGSKVELDSASAIRLDYDGVQRRISLIQGSAIFDVAPMTGQETRPFVVQSAAGQTRALGTRFVVEREGDRQAWVGVLQHSVEVALQATPKKGPSERVLKQGQAARYSPQDGVKTLDQFDVERATSWRRGVLIFDRLPLANVIEQLNRYRPGRVVLANSALADREVSGVFRLDMLDTALGTLTQELQVQRLDLAGLSLIY
ncbi:FecR family protein [Pseudomonas sp. O64]|uniref:FecR family protein n=1 Tax=Pseudomonas TaxID=286 RepID=UPI000BA0F0B3|nr:MULTISPECIES: FecR family protein [unclassified Pseudomonas]MCV2227079.1 FecR family protein [Pseudomonas sp. AU10]OZO03214.1 siderophore-interacting protein [Pseudomonas sp. IB20]UNM19316.1 FecR family protein [Pseudomonas sp. ArH3a]UXZ22057.1 FecR family protein [Pseudomonas sp. YeP6b]